MASKIDVVNFALIALGNDPIVSLSAGTKAARIALTLYDQNRQALLREHPWKFAITEVILNTPLATAPLFGYSFAYQLPFDFIKFARPEFLTQQFHRQGMILQSDDNAVNLVYVADQPNEGTWEPLFVDACSARLAWKMATSVAGDPNKTNMAFQAFNAALSSARFANAIETPVRTLEAGDWIDSRLATGPDLASGDGY